MYDKSFDDFCKQFQKNDASCNRWFYFRAHPVSFDAPLKEISYTRANWNAFILYNYLNYRIHYDGQYYSKPTKSDEDDFLVSRCS